MMPEKTAKSTGMLVKQDVYLESGIHIGTKMKSHDMDKFIYKRRDDDLYILDLKKIDERLRHAARVISKYAPEDVLVVATRIYSGNAARKFGKITGIQVQNTRFVPGTMTNINSEYFIEPKLLIVCDPKGERSAILEAAKVNVPVIGICDTENDTKYIDLIIPANNKGRKSLALIFYLLTREIMMARGEISSYDEFQYNISYFEKMEE